MTRLAPALVVAAAALAYAGTLGFEFVHDDELQILGNPWMREFQVRELLLRSVWDFDAAPGERVVSNYYRPVFMLTLAVTGKLFGFTPAPFHALAVAVHAAVSLLLLVCLRFAGVGPRVSLAAALLFAVHPVHSESVAVVSGMTDPLTALLALAVTAAWLRLHEAHGTGYAALAVASGVAYLLCLLAKETGAMLLPMLVAAEWTARARLRDAVGRLAPLVVAAIAYTGLRLFVLGEIAPRARLDAFGVQGTLLHAGRFGFDYLVTTLWPFDLHAFHVFRPADGAGVGPWLAASLFLGTTCVFGAECLVQRARWTLTPLWFIAFLAPVLTLRYVGEAVFAERYLYLPSMAVCFAVPWAIDRGLSGGMQRAAWLALAPACVGLLIATTLRNEVWRDDEGLYRATLAREPGAHVFRQNLAVLLMNRGEDFAALVELERIHRDGRDDPGLRYHLGIVRQKLADHEGAIPHYEAALAREPWRLDVRFNLAHAWVETGRPREALALYDAIAKADPDYPALDFNRGLALRAAGDRQEALAAFARALERDSNTAELHYEMGLTELLSGASGSAAKHFARAAASAPRFREADEDPSGELERWRDRRARAFLAASQEWRAKGYEDEAVRVAEQAGH